MITDTDLAYAAGIFDADGCTIISYVNTYKGRKYAAVRPCIIGQDYELMEWLCERWPGRVYRAPGAYNYRPTDTKKFLEDMLRYARLKRPQLELGLEFMNIPYGKTEEIHERFVVESKRLNSLTSSAFHGR